MIRQIDHQKESTAKAIQQIQQRAYLIEAQMMQFDGIPQLRESVLEIQSSNEIYIGYEEENRLWCFISFLNKNKKIDIHRLAVDPEHFRKGVGGKIFAFIIRKI